MHVILFAGLPLLEIAVFIAIGAEIGVFNTILLCLVAAIAGIALVQRQGLKTAFAFREVLENGMMPADLLFDTLCLFAAGILLIVPGFISDLAALALLIPRTRGLICRYFQRKQTAAGTAPSDIIDAEFVRVDDHEGRESFPYPDARLDRSSNSE